MPGVAGPPSCSRRRYALSWRRAFRARHRGPSQRSSLCGGETAAPARAAPRHRGDTHLLQPGRCRVEDGSLSSDRLGSRSGCRASARRELVSLHRTLDVTTSVVAGFLQHGLGFATIDYRLGNGRAAIDDVACAVRYLRRVACDLGINGSRIGAIGQSVGGQLVSLLGVTDPQAGFDVGQYLNESSRVQAVVDEWGPVIFDTTLLRHLPNITSVFGTSNLNHSKPILAPLSYLTKDDPPFPVVQGAQDTTVPPDQSTRLAAELDMCGHLESIDRGGACRSRTDPSRGHAHAVTHAGPRRRRVLLRHAPPPWISLARSDQTRPAVPMTKPAHRTSTGASTGSAVCSSDELLRELRDLVEVLLDVGQGLAAVAVGLF